MRAPPRRTYGKKKSTATAAAAAVFGSASESSPLLQPQPSSPGLTRQSSLKLSSPQLSPSRSLRDALVDITSAVSNLTVASEESESSGTESAASSKISNDLRNLEPLLEAYETDRGQPLGVKTWLEVIEGATAVAKIAEASYAEVYRVTTKHGSSIIKVMQLKVESDPPSLNGYTTVAVEQVVSEIRIMNAMTEVPGYVTFKDALLVQGKPNKEIIKAWDYFHENSPQARGVFPRPSSYSEQSIFLVLELGDAGEVLEDFDLNSMNKWWDIFLGVVIALSRAEIDAEFEHRDLHENNICVNVHPPPKDADKLPESVKYGRSGMEITLIDYGLSRATLQNGEVMFFDLENDLDVFRGQDGMPQFDTYRRMRTHLFTGKHNMFKRSWHTDESRSKNNGHTWAEFTPYSNVLWLKYLFRWMTTSYFRAQDPEDNPNRFYQANGINELRSRFDLRTRDGNFSCAAEVLLFANEHGWISDEQMEDNGVDSTILSEFSILSEPQ